MAGGAETEGAESELIRVVAAVVCRDQRLLLARRPAGKRHAGCWEMPGGKLHDGESLAVAARRELAEELGLEVLTVAAPLARFQDPGSTFLVCFCPVEVAGEPQALEHDEVRWVTVEEALELALAPSDRRFLESVTCSVNCCTLSSSSSAGCRSEHRQPD